MGVRGRSLANVAIVTQIVTQNWSSARCDLGRPYRRPQVIAAGVLLDGGWHRRRPNNDAEVSGCECHVTGLMPGFIITPFDGASGGVACANQVRTGGIWSSWRPIAVVTLSGRRPFTAFRDHLDLGNEWVRCL
jgi:hypothetical protein